MSSYTFFLKNGAKIAKSCSVVVSGDMIILYSIRNTNSATYVCRSKAERHQLLRILESKGAIVSMIVEEES